jgi:dipeptidyl aminopeptidase/acylaminoacyl peptidase
LLSLGSAASGLGDRAHEQPWTPRTSIELRYFALDLAHPADWPVPGERGASGILYSPDRRYFLFIRCGGDLQQDAVVAELTIYETDAVAAALRDPETAAVQPLRRLEIRSWSSSDQPISNLRWDEDSRGIIFSTVDRFGRRQFSYLDVRSGLQRNLADAPARDRLFASYRAGGFLSYSRARIREAFRYPAQWVERQGQSALPWSGTLLLYPEAQGSGEGPLVVRAGCRNRPARRVMGFARPPVAVAISPDGCSSILSGQLTGEGWTHVLLDHRSGRWQRMADAPPYVATTPAWSSDGRLVAFLAPPVACASPICMFDVARRRTVTVMDGGGEAVMPRSTMRWLAADRLMVVAPGRSGPAGLEVRVGRDGIWRASRPVPADGPSPSLQSPLSVTIEQDLNSPARVVASLGARRLILSQPDPALAGVRRGRWQEFRWDDPDGIQHRAALMLPPLARPEDPPPPVVINPYYFEQSGPHRDYFLPDGEHRGAESTAQAMAARGMAVLWLDAWNREPSPGGHTGGTPAEGPSFVRRLDAVIAELARRRLVDPNRVGLAGFSRGGYMTLYAATHPGRHPIAAFAALDNYLGSLAVDMERAAVDRSTLEAIWGNYFQHRDEWQAVDTLSHVDRVGAPILFTKNLDGGIRFDGLEAVLGAFVMARRPFDLLIFPEGQHNLLRPGERLALMNALVDWMAFWLKGEAPPDARRARMWSQMATLWRRQQAWEAAGHPIGSVPAADFLAGPSAPLTPPRN